MSNRFRAYFDGKVLVPDKPLSLPLNQAIELEVIAMPSANGGPPASVADRLAALRALARSIEGQPIPLEALRRKHLYDDWT